MRLKTLYFVLTRRENSFVSNACVVYGVSHGQVFTCVTFPSSHLPNEASSINPPPRLSFVLFPCPRIYSIA